MHPEVIFHRLGWADYSVLWFYSMPIILPSFWMHLLKIVSNEVFIILLLVGKPESMLRSVLYELGDECVDHNMKVRPRWSPEQSLVLNPVPPLENE
jgi:hypothetical protein